MESKLRIHRSLTIKQMATVSAVALLVVCLFIIVQLFHFVKQRRIEYARQMENIAHTVREPLSEAVLRGDVPEAERLLTSLKPAGVLGGADVNLSDSFQALHVDFSADPPVPSLISWVFHLPVKISLPLYSPEHTGLPRPLAWLVLEADSTRVYQFILSTMATMVITYLLLALILSVSISWFINRLVIHPLRKVCCSLLEQPSSSMHTLLVIPKGHRDDEMGILIKGINRRQTQMLAVFDDYKRHRSQHPVTGLPDQQLFLAVAEQYLQLSARHAAALMVMRIDTLNAGLDPDDNLLLRQMLATRVVDLKPATDIYTAQLSECEFVILFKSYQRPSGLMRIVEQAIESLTQTLTLNSVTLRPQVSIGLVIHDDANLSATTLLEHGIAAMNHASLGGKNRALFFDPQVTEMARQRLQQIGDILKDIDHKQSALYLQPQIDMRTGKITGAEVLLRAGRAEDKYSRAEQIITTAEPIAVIPEIGRWVVEESCRILAHWQARGVSLPLSVNISAAQLCDSAVISCLQAALRRYKIHPATLVLELTETATLSDPGGMISLLRSLAETGVSVVLDDFGMGYSDLHYLHQLRSLPLRRVKLDRSFISVLPADDAMVRVISSVAGIAKLEIVAEGVETETQRDWLLARGIYIAQGAFYAPALPESQFTQQWLNLPETV